MPTQLAIPLSIGFGTLAIILVLWYYDIHRKQKKALQALENLDDKVSTHFALLPTLTKLNRTFMDQQGLLIREITDIRKDAESAYSKTDPDHLETHLTVIKTLYEKMAYLVMSLNTFTPLKGDPKLADALAAYEINGAAIQAAQQFYNSQAEEFNRSIQHFPGKNIAKITRMAKMPRIEIKPPKPLKIEKP
jgi:hypothetical protein